MHNYEFFPLQEKNLIVFPWHIRLFTVITCESNALHSTNAAHYEGISILHIRSLQLLPYLDNLEILILIASTINGLAHHLLS